MSRDCSYRVRLISQQKENSTDLHFSGEQRNGVDFRTAYGPRALQTLGNGWLNFKNEAVPAELSKRVEQALQLEQLGFSALVTPKDIKGKQYNGWMGLSLACNLQVCINHSHQNEICSLPKITDAHFAEAFVNRNSLAWNIGCSKKLQIVPWWMQGIIWNTVKLHR